MKKINLFLVFAGIAVNCFGQNPVYEWAKQMGDPGASIGESIAVDPAGKVYTTGLFWDTADFDPGPGLHNLIAAGDADVFVSKLNASGNFAWAKKIGGTDFEMGNAIALDGSWNVYVAGYFYGTVDFDPGPGTYNVTASGTNEDIFICKLNSAGNFVWVRRMGGAIYDRCDAMAVDANGNVYTAGHFYGTADFDPGISTYNLTSGYMWYPNPYISKLDSNGNFIWAKSFTGTSIGHAEAITADLIGNVYVTGYFQNTFDFDPGSDTFNLTATFLDAYIVKLDVNGNLIWADQVTGTSWGHSITIDNNGNVYTTGHFSDTADFDPGPGAKNLVSEGLRDVFILKTNSNGDFLWARSFGSFDGDEGNAVSLDAVGNVYTTGYFKDTVDFDPGSGIYILNSAKADIFISKLDSSGHFVWAKKMGGSDYDVGIAMAADTLGTIWLTGIFRDTVDFNAPFSANLITGDDGNIFVAKYSQTTTTGIFENEFSENFSIFPNPTTGTIQLTLTKDVKGNVEIVNVMGEKVFQTPLPASPRRGEESYAVLDVSFLAKGIYVLRVDEQSRKLVIE